MATPYSKIMIHQPSIGGAGGQATDLEIVAREIIATRRILAGIYERTTHKTIEEILRDIERDYYLTATEALAYGLIDQVLDKSSRTATNMTEA